MLSIIKFNCILFYEKYAIKYHLACSTSTKLKYTINGLAKYAVYHFLIAFDIT